MNENMLSWHFRICDLSDCDLSFFEWPIKNTKLDLIQEFWNAFLFV